METSRDYKSVATRVLVLIFFKLMTTSPTRRLWKKCGSIWLVSSQLCLKTSAFTTLAEAHAMEYVRQNTNIPVPKVHMAFEHKNRVYILMERIDGEDLRPDWVARSESSKQAVLAQLKDMVQQLRNLPSPEKLQISNVDGGPIYDIRLPGSALWGPFESVQAFHRKLRNGIELEQVADDSIPGLREMITLQVGPWSKVVFTHGDLISFNILCRGDNTVGIVDWETAGWFPEYWEYTTAWNANPQNAFWQQEVNKFLEPWPRALEMETTRRRYLGDY